MVGGAGTGKTTLILYFIERVGLQLDEVLFVSYMGKVSPNTITGIPNVNTSLAFLSGTVYPSSTTINFIFFGSFSRNVLMEKKGD